MLPQRVSAALLFTLPYFLRWRVIPYNPIPNFHLSYHQVSYNAAGVLAHMASDGPEAWTVKEPAREAVLNRVASAVARWDLHAERNINYR